MNSLKKMLLSLGALSGILVIWMISMACGGDIELPVFGTVYASPTSYPFNIPSSGTFVDRINDAEFHVSNYITDPTSAVTLRYNTDNFIPFSYLYATYGGTESLTNCTDHDTNLDHIVTANNVSGFEFTMQTDYGGRVWVQYASQCEDNGVLPNETGEGIYFKGSRMYASGDFPDAPDESSIVIDIRALTTCSQPWSFNPPFDEYGCGNEDIFSED